MFASFEKAFNKNKAINKVPEPIIKALNNKLPSGFKYEVLDEESLYLKTVDDNMRFLFQSINNDFNAKSSQELLEYLYRTQKELEIKNSTVDINGEKFNVKDLIVFPLKDLCIDEENCKFKIIPPPFPGPFELAINYEEDKIMKIMIQRQPYADLNKSLFKSINLDSMEIVYIIDELNNSMKINYKIKLKKAKSVEEILISSKIYKMFENGEIIINGNTIKANIKSNKMDESFNELIEFWEKVYDLSKCFNIEFKPKEKILYDDVKIVDSLYNSFIIGVDNEEYIDNDKFTLTFSNKINTSEIKSDNEMVMQYNEYKEYFVLGEKIKLFCIITLSNFKIESVIELQENPFKYELKAKSLSNKGILKITRFFKDKDSFNLYKENYNKIF
jgi:hypothetical protein